MFKYDHEKSRDWAATVFGARAWAGDSCRSDSCRSDRCHNDSATIGGHSRRALPLPPRPTAICSRVPRMPSKTTVPLKVWIVASASCFAVCAALVLATVVITKWGTTDVFSQRRYYEEPAPIYSHPQTRNKAEINEIIPSATEDEIPSVEESDLNFPILGKLAMFKNMVGPRERKPDLDSKPQIHPLHDTTIQHQERKIEKKHQARVEPPTIPEFKPTLPDVFVNKKLEIQLPDGYFNRYDSYDADYYTDENLYNDYIESTSMTSYLIEKVQELHDWITTDADFEIKTKNGTKPKINEFSQVLKALNESLTEGNVTIIMYKLKELYYGDNNGTNSTMPRRLILSNSTDLLSFGILSLDVMLLHNIQLMAWENQEHARHKMLRDPDVYAFNALFLDPSKIEPRSDHGYHEKTLSAKRQNHHQEEEFDLGRNIIENVLEIGMSTARAAIHLGRAYKNTKLVLSSMSTKDNLSSNIQSQLARNVVPNSHALQHLQSFSRNATGGGGNGGNGAPPVYTELDCLWLLYCRNLAATAKLNAPYGLMARINGVALRMLTGELSAERALDTMLTEAVSGWSELKCDDMFPRCSKVNAATVVMDSILQPLRKSQLANSKP